MKNTRRMLCFAGRCAKEIARDPLTLFFGLAFPLVLLLMMTLIQANIPVKLFEISRLAPGVAVFGQSFLALFSAMLISRDRASAFLARLYSTPLRARDFLFGYLLPLLPMALVQGAIVYAVALILGLPFSPRVVWALLVGMVPALLFIAPEIFERLLSVVLIFPMYSLRLSLSVVISLFPSGMICTVKSPLLMSVIRSVTVVTGLIALLMLK